MSAIITLSSQVPPDIRERLRALDPDLELREQLRLATDHTAQDDHNTRQGTHFKVWAICLKWRPDDPRRAMIQRGDMAPDADFDWLCDIPADCTVDQVPGYLAANLRPTQSGWVAKLCEKVARWNEDLQLRRGEELADWGAKLAVDMAHQGKSGAAIPRSFGGI